MPLGLALINYDSFSYNSVSKVPIIDVISSYNGNFAAGFLLKRFLKTYHIIQTKLVGMIQHKPYIYVAL